MVFPLPAPGAIAASILIIAAVGVSMLTSGAALRKRSFRWQR